MTNQHYVCRLCCTVKENDGKLLDENLAQMLETLLTERVWTVGESVVICNSCCSKLETNYNFKRKCVFTEDSISPFVSDNVKLDLKEVYHQINKSEDIENEKNVCRLCLELVDNDMTLSDDEKEDFQQYFPEINLTRTNFVVLCSTCYDLLHKYFLFLTSCVHLKQEVCNYSLYKTENKIEIFKEDIGNKIENYQEVIMNIKEENEKHQEELHEELDIKCDTEETDERYDTDNREESLEEMDSDTISSNIVNDQEKLVITSNTKTWECVFCNHKHKTIYSLHRRIQAMHSDPSSVRMFKCLICDYESKCLTNINAHIDLNHKNITYRCDKYYYQTPKFTYKCKQCDRHFKYEIRLKRHVSAVHSASSKVAMWKCKKCDYESKDKIGLNMHVRTSHGPSKIAVCKCKTCDYESKHEIDIKIHGRLNHAASGTSNISTT